MQLMEMLVDEIRASYVGNPFAESLRRPNQVKTYNTLLGAGARIQNSLRTQTFSLLRCMIGLAVETSARGSNRGFMERRLLPSMLNGCVHVDWSDNSVICFGRWIASITSRQSSEQETGL
jgi:hypothetical protein